METREGWARSAAAKRAAVVWAASERAVAVESAEPERPERPAALRAVAERAAWESEGGCGAWEAAEGASALWASVEGGC